MIVKRLLLPLIAAALVLVTTACSPRAPNSNSSGLNIFSFLTDSTIWDDMSGNFDLAKRPYPQPLQKQIKWFARNPTYVERLASNASPYIYYVYSQTERRGLPAELALLPMIESAYDPFGYSHSGAIGLWQMMPGTASGFGLKINWWYDGRRDVVASTNAALAYLSYLNDFFDHRWLLAIAAYNSGEGTVQHAMEYNKAHHLSTSFWDLPLPPQTEVYVPKLLALSIMFANPGDYHIKLPAVPDEPYFGAVEMHDQIGIDLAAKLAETKVSVIRTLNPGYRRWATQPQGDYLLLLPVKKVAIFKKHLSELPKGAHVTWRHHTVRSGENLLLIAKNYHTTADILKRVNGLKSSLIHPKQILLVPLASKGKFNRVYANGGGANIAEDKVPGPRKYIHTVGPHDNLWTIARRYGVKVSQITFWNNMDYKSQIHVGQKLIIWLPPHSYNTTVYVDHTVHSGDNLRAISKKYQVPVKTLQRDNHLHGSMIRVGQKLKVPVKTYKQHHYKNVMLIHHVRPGDTLNRIAKDNHVSVHDLLKWNHLHDRSILKVGQRILIYKTKEK